MRTRWSSSLREEIAADFAAHQRLPKRLPPGFQVTRERWNKPPAPLSEAENERVRRFKQAVTRVVLQPLPRDHVCQCGTAFGTARALFVHQRIAEHRDDRSLCRRPELFAVLAPSP